MKTITKIFMGAVAVCFAGNVAAQCYFRDLDGASWSTRSYFKLFEFDASLVDEDLYPTGAKNGGEDNLEYGITPQVAKSPYGSGTLSVPLLDEDENETDLTYEFSYVNCVFAPKHFTAAYTTVVLRKEDPSCVTVQESDDNPDGCYYCFNNEYQYSSPAYSQQGFIELNRAGSLAELNPTDEDGEEIEMPEGSHHLGYVQMDNLNYIDVIQWSFSGTARKRGIMMEIKWEGSDEWEILRSQPSDVGWYSEWASQGYTIESSIGSADPRNTRYGQSCSVRWITWHGDERTWAEEHDREIDEDDPEDVRPSGYYWVKEDPSGTWQVARLHRIIVYSSQTATSIDNNMVSNFKVTNLNGTLQLTEEGTVEIYTIDGKLVKTATGMEMNVNDLGAGVYVVKAKSASGVTKNLKIAL